MQQRLPSLLEHPIAFAHRGARAHARENTIDAFELALRLGATGLESDVWLTADGVPVLDHDGVVRVQRRKRSIPDLRRDQLPSHIPTLAELFDACGTTTTCRSISRAMRSGRRCSTSCAMPLPTSLRGCGCAIRDWRSCSRSAHSTDDVKLVDSTRLQRISEGPERRAATLAEHGIDGINMHHSDWNGGLVTLFHRFERRAFGWDLQHEHVLRPALRMGIDGVLQRPRRRDGRRLPRRAGAAR